MTGVQTCALPISLPALWLVLTLVLLMIHIVPGDPAEQMLGEDAAPGAAAQLRHALGLDRPRFTIRHSIRALFARSATWQSQAIVQIPGAGQAHLS